MAKRQEILAEYDRSGMSGQAFAKWVGITYSTFASWIQKRRRDQNASTPEVPPKWMEVVSAPVVSAALVIELTSGAKLTVGDESQAKLAAVLIRSLSC